MVQFDILFLAWHKLRTCSLYGSICNFVPYVVHY